LPAAADGGDSDAVGEIIEEIEESWDDDGLKVDTDKAWDAIRRRLTDGTLDPDSGEYPLSHAVLGDGICTTSATSCTSTLPRYGMWQMLCAVWTECGYAASSALSTAQTTAEPATTRTSSTPGTASWMFKRSTAQAAAAQRAVAFTAT
jgi:hypothetical protein